MLRNGTDDKYLESVLLNAFNHRAKDGMKPNGAGI